MAKPADTNTITVSVTQRDKVAADNVLCAGQEATFLVTVENGKLGDALLVGAVNSKGEPWAAEFYLNEKHTWMKTVDIALATDQDPGKAYPDYLVVSKSTDVDAHKAFIVHVYAGKDPKAFVWPNEHLRGWVNTQKVDLKPTDGQAGSPEWAVIGYETKVCK